MENIFSGDATHQIEFALDFLFFSFLAEKNRTCVFVLAACIQLFPIPSPPHPWLNAAAQQGRAGAIKSDRKRLSGRNGRRIQEACRKREAGSHSSQQDRFDRPRVRGANISVSEEEVAFYGGLHQTKGDVADQAGRRHLGLA